VLALTGITLETNGILGAIRDGLDGLDFGNIILGGGSITVGGAMIGKALGSAILGGAIGGIVAGVPAFFVGIYDACKNGLSWLSGVLIPAGATAAGAAIGAIIGSLGGPITMAGGALIGLAVGLITDGIIAICQNWEGISVWFDQYVIKPVASFFTWLWGGISGGAITCWNAIVGFFSPAIDWFGELFGSIWQTISDVFYNIGVIASGCWEIIKAVWGVVSKWFDTTLIQPLAGFFGGLWDGIVEKAAIAWEGIKTVFSTVATFFSDTFSAAWRGIVKVFSIAGEIFVDIKDGIVTAFKFVVNSIIKGLNKVIAIPFNAINSALDFIRDIEIAGIQPFGGLIRIHVPQIPLLAEGGMLDAGQMFIAREAGPELVGSIGRRTAVVNNDQIVEGISHGVSAANTESNMLLREQNALLRAMLEKETGVYLDGKTITKSVEKHQRERGRVLVTGGAY
jgi:hypothetical protein